MIDLLVNAARFDFKSLKKSETKNVSTSILLLIILTVCSIVLIFIFQLSKMDTPKALTIIQEKEYQITQKGLSLDEYQIQEINQQLSDTGYSISSSAIFLGKNELLSFNQLLLLSQSDELSNETINQTLEKKEPFIRNFVLFYLYLKESLVLFWVIILAIILARISQTYTKKAEIYSYQRLFGWVTSLVIDPLLIYCIMAFLEVRWSYRMFIFTLLYTMIVFIFSKYLITHVTIEGEQKRSLS